MRGYKYIAHQLRQSKSKLVELLVQQHLRDSSNRTCFRQDTHCFEEKLMTTPSQIFLARQSSHTRILHAGNFLARNSRQLLNSHFNSMRIPNCKAVQCIIARREAVISGIRMHWKQPPLTSHKQDPWPTSIRPSSTQSMQNKAFNTHQDDPKSTSSAGLLLHRQSPLTEAAKTSGEGVPQNHIVLSTVPPLLLPDTHRCFLRSILRWWLSNSDCEQIPYAPIKGHTKLFQDMHCLSSTPQGRQEPWTIIRGQGQSWREVSLCT